MTPTHRLVSVWSDHGWIPPFVVPYGCTSPVWGPTTITIANLYSDGTVEVFWEDESLASLMFAAYPAEHDA